MSNFPLVLDEGQEVVVYHKETDEILVFEGVPGGTNIHAHEDLFPNIDDGEPSVTLNAIQRDLFIVAEYEVTDAFEVLGEL
jgi:hypothetical protein